jgi:dimethylamine/trimethylamine dehydrogenase
VPVTSRQPDDGLWQALQGADLASLIRIGDCKAPGIIAQAVFDGHRAGRMLGSTTEAVRRERIVVA